MRLATRGLTLRRASADRGDGDGSNEGFDALKIGIAFGRHVDRGEVIVAEQIAQTAEPPAENHHVGGREGEREFLRWGVLLFAGIRVGFQRVLNQLAGVKSVAVFLVEMKLDTGAILAGTGIAVVFDGVHGVIED
jgi:hypothetical protein